MCDCCAQELLGRIAHLEEQSEQSRQLAALAAAVVDDLNLAVPAESCQSFEALD